MGLVRIWPRIRMDQTLGFEAIDMQILEKKLQDPGTTTISLRGYNISYKPSSVKVGLFLHLLHHLIPSSVVPRNFQFLEGWETIQFQRLLFQYIINLVVLI